ncbi:MAG: hypothetical protein D3914_15945 [Candidatus Electrothrix sp. LOE2]|nr:hypothetical protein [Candidatus Electrothrix sp. LOE2]
MSGVVGWWFISCVIGLLAGLVAGLYFWNWYIGGGVFLTVSFAVSRLNRKRRFYSAAWTTLSCLIGVNVLPYIESMIDLTPYLGAQAKVFFKLDAGQTPVLSLSLAVVSIALFVLDYLENKD